MIDADPAHPRRTELLTAHARYIASLNGRYIPAVDMGTTVSDLDLIGRYVPRVSSQRRDPSWYTAKGVVASIEAAIRFERGTDLTGVRVAVQGLGHVGAHVATMLLDAGAVLSVADVDAPKVWAVVTNVGGTATPVEDVLTADVDVVCPCAGGAAITEPIVDRLKARFVIGAANNVLADDALVEGLGSRGIVYVPEYVANAGGLIACDAEIRGKDDGLTQRVERIGETVTSVLRRARQAGTDTITVATELATARLAARRVQRPWFAPAQ